MKKIALCFSAIVRLPIYRLMLAQGISLVGSRCTAFALGIWLFQTTGNTAEILLIPFFQEVPALLLNPILGMLVDRYSRKRLLILSDTAQAMGSALLALSVWRGAFSVPFLYAVVVAQGLFASLQGLAADAAVAPMTGEENRLRVNALRQMLFPLAGIVAPPVAGMFFFKWGLVSVLAVDLVTFLASMAMLAFTGIPPAQGGWEEEGEEQRGRMDGFRYLGRHRGLILYALFFGLLNFLWNGPLELITPYLIAAGTTPAQLSLATSFMSIGVLLGAAVLTLQKVRDRKGKLFALAALWNGIWTLAFGIARQPIPLAISLFFLMMPLPAAGALFHTQLQNRVPHKVQGRVFSIVYQISGGTAPISFLLVGPLTDKVFTPMMREGAPWPLHRLFGSGAESGMGLMLSLSGLLICVLSILFLIQKRPGIGEDAS